MMDDTGFACSPSNLHLQMDFFMHKILGLHGSICAFTV